MDATYTTSFICGVVACYFVVSVFAFCLGKKTTLCQVNRILAQRRNKWLRVMARQDTVLGEAVIDTTRPIL